MVLTAVGAVTLERSLQSRTHCEEAGITNWVRIATAAGGVALLGGAAWVSGSGNTAVEGAKPSSLASTTTGPGSVSKVEAPKGASGGACPVTGSKEEVQSLQTPSFPIYTVSQSCEIRLFGEGWSIQYIRIRIMMGSGPIGPWHYESA